MDSKQNSNKIIEAFFILLIIPFYQIYYIGAWAITIKYAWAWFAVPTFGVNVLTFPQAIAVTALTSIIFIKSMKIEPPLKNDDGSTNLSPIITAVILPWVCFVINAFVAWIFI